MKVFPLTIAVTIVTLFTASHAFAGWVQTNKNGDKTFFSDGKVKMVPADAPMWTSMDANKGTITMVDDQKKAYTEGTPENYCKWGMSLRDEMMKNMPPEMRQMMEDMKEQKPKQPSPKVTISKAGAGGTIAGYKTETYNIAVNGTPTNTVWLAEDTPLMKDMKKHIVKITRMASDMDGCMSEGMGEEFFSLENSKEYAKLMERGIALKETSNGDVSMEVLSIKKADVPNSSFSPPSGYKKLSIKEMMAGQMGGM